MLILLSESPSGIGDACGGNRGLDHFGPTPCIRSHASRLYREAQSLPRLCRPLRTRTPRCIRRLVPQDRLPKRVQPKKDLFLFLLAGKEPASPNRAHVRLSIRSEDACLPPRRTAGRQYWPPTSAANRHNTAPAGWGPGNPRGGRYKLSQTSSLPPPICL